MAGKAIEPGNMVRSVLGFGHLVAVTGFAGGLVVPDQALILGVWLMAGCTGQSHFSMYAVLPVTQFIQVAGTTHVRGSG